MPASYGTYVVDYLTVIDGATLTIEPGTVVKFTQYGYMYIYGTLVADGEPGQQIYFTSIKDDDDAAGGDTNGDGDDSSPAPGDWSHLYFYQADLDNLLDNVVVRYGGGGGYNGAVYIYASSVELTNNTISDNGQYGIYGVNSTLSVTGNTISGHTTGAIHLDVNSLLNPDSDISNNTLSGNALDTIVLGDTLSEDATLPASFGTYVVDYLTVADGATLTIEPGTVVKFTQYGYMYIYGTLVADGEPGQQIYFTSIKDDDDAAGGDTNGDGDDSSPAPGDWNYLYFYEADLDNLLDNVVVRYGGGGGYNGAVYIYASSVELTNNTISDNGQYGIYGVNSTLNATDNIISGHTTGAIHLDVNSLLNPDSDISNNTLSGNALDTIVLGDTLSEDATLPASFGTYVVDYLTVADGATLTIEPGTVVKFTQYGYDVYLWHAGGRR